MPESRPAHRLRHLFLSPGWTVDWHAHDGFHEIVAVVAGSIETCIDGDTRLDQPGTIKLQPRGVPHAERCIGDHGLELLVLCWNPGRSEQCRGWPATIHDESGRITEVLQWLAQPGLGPRLTTLLAETAAAAYAEIARGVEPSLVAKVRSYIVRHLAEPIQLDDLARCVHLSRFYFIRQFRRATGCSPMQMVTTLRVEAAHDLLLSSGLPLRAIAERVGFSDESSLSHAIRKHFGHAPGALRRTM